MKPHVSRRIMWLTMASIACAGAAFFLLVFLPTARTIARLRDEVRLSQDYIAQTNSLQNRIKQIETEVDEVRQFDSQWQTNTPGHGQLAKLFGRISQSAKQSGATTTHFEPQDELPMQVLQRVPIKMTISGRYADVCRLLAAIEQMPEPIWIDELEIKRDQTGKAVEAGLKLDVFASSPEKSD